MVLFYRHNPAEMHVWRRRPPRWILDVAFASAFALAFAFALASAFALAFAFDSDFACDFLCCCLLCDFSPRAVISRVYGSQLVAELFGRGR